LKDRCLHLFRFLIRLFRIDISAALLAPHAVVGTEPSDDLKVSGDAPRAFGLSF
jgi:hypothetical protein